MTGSKMDRKEADDFSGTAVYLCTRLQEALLESLWFMAAFGNLQKR